MFIPSHIGIKGNERADQAATRASRRFPELIPTYYKDIHFCITTSFRDKRSLEWSRSVSKLRDVMNELKDRPCNISVPRKQEVIINRLRLGHCIFSSRYRMEGLPLPPQCNFCQSELMSVKHVLVECTALQEPRDNLLRDPSQNNNVLTLRDTLGTRCNVGRLFHFLAAVGLTDLI